MCVFVHAGIEVGGWEGRTSHQVTGTISFPNPNTVVIDNFSYDNGGISESEIILLRVEI